MSETQRDLDRQEFADDWFARFGGRPVVVPEALLDLIAERRARRLFPPEAK